jgi:E3 ubiquitin-protein ligase RAD18
MAELPDSTDWISTSLPLFEPLEASLRCEVCKEFYENPVIATCSHTFCSLCIRRCISNDGKCPACKSPCQADRLIPNFVVREIVSRFQVARPTALELARRQKDDAIDAPVCKKRRLEDTDIDETEPARHTRSRITRSGNGMVDKPLEIVDSEDDGDVEFIPEGMVNCPICSTSMKEEQVWLHLGNGSCSGQQKSAAGRGTRSRYVFIRHCPVRDADGIQGQTTNIRVPF